MTLNKKCLFTLLLLGTASDAALLHPLNDEKVIEVPISGQSLTRITVKNDRILNVFGLATEYALETDTDQGQIFIRPGSGSSNPISLTLTTEKGFTQDLRLIPKEKAPEALILEDRQDNVKAEDILPNREEIEDLIHACIEGRIPQGYKQMPLDLKTTQGPYHLIREIRGVLRGLTYEVKNTSNIPLILSEEAFVKKGSLQVIAIFLTKRTLKPGERSTIHVVAKH